MVEFFGGRCLETGDMATLRIDPGHHVSDDAILASGVHGLKDHQDRIFVLCIEDFLQFGHAGHCWRAFQGIGLILEAAGKIRIVVLLERDLLAGLNGYVAQPELHVFAIRDFEFPLLVKIEVQLHGGAFSLRIYRTRSMALPCCTLLQINANPTERNKQSGKVSNPKGIAKCRPISKQCCRTPSHLQRK